VTIEAQTITEVGRLPNGFARRGPAVALTPHGQTFLKPVEITWTGHTSASEGASWMVLSRAPGAPSYEVSGVFDGDSPPGAMPTTSFSEWVLGEYTPPSCLPIVECKNFGCEESASPTAYGPCTPSPERTPGQCLLRDYSDGRSAICITRSSEGRPAGSLECRCALNNNIQGEVHTMNGPFNDAYVAWVLDEICGSTCSELPTVNDCDPRFLNAFNGSNRCAVQTKCDGKLYHMIWQGSGVDCFSGDDTLRRLKRDPSRERPCDAPAAEFPSALYHPTWYDMESGCGFAPLPNAPERVVPMPAGCTDLTQQGALVQKAGSEEPTWTGGPNGDYQTGDLLDGVYTLTSWSAGGIYGASAQRAVTLRITTSGGVQRWERFTQSDQPGFPEGGRRQSGIFSAYDPNSGPGSGADLSYRIQCEDGDEDNIGFTGRFSRTAGGFIWGFREFGQIWETYQRQP
jgi:hypothetical protein